ncbi:MAG: alpha-amylase family protein [Turicibacter sp.]
MNYETEFQKRLKKNYDHLKWTYHSVYDKYGATERDFGRLLGIIKSQFQDRTEELKELDQRDKHWFMAQDMVGMMLYVDLFAGNLENLIAKITYLKELGITYVHLMPLLKPREGENDGGYAVADYRNIDPRIGDMDQFIDMLAEFRKAGIAVCIDYVINHTAKEHEWAKAALAGDWGRQNMYMMYEHYDIPEAFNRTVPEVLPDKCPGNFTYYKEMNRHVFTSFSDFQWDLNFKNPYVLEQMIDIMLYLANTGVNIIRLDAIPFMWKELGTNCRNLDVIHDLMHMLQLVKDIVCPSLVLLGEAIVEPYEIVKYFGNESKVECELMYNANFMVNIWNSFATRDTRVMRMDAKRYQSPKSGAWINYARCHDDIGWGFSEDAVWSTGSNPVHHKQFIIDFYSQKFPGSFATGEIYQYNPATGDARINGTLASLVGLEKAMYEQNEEDKAMAISRIILTHALIFAAQGIPLIYSCDELATINDYSYLQDPDKCQEGRWVHRPKMDWDRANKRHDLDCAEGQVFSALKDLIEIRKTQPLFAGDVDNEIFDLSNYHVYGMGKYQNDEHLLLLFNFSEHEQFVKTNEIQTFKANKKMCDLITNTEVDLTNDYLVLKPYQCMWLTKEKK